MFKLVIQDDEGKTTVVPLIRDEITIGRKEGNTIRLTERNVSRRHARILRSNNEVQIEDLGSYNGIRVNNARIAERVSLRISDQVQIGDYKLYLKAEGVEQVDDARTMPIERIETPSGTTTESMPVVTNGATTPMPAPIPSTPAPPVARTLGVADTDPAGRPVATAAQVAALNPQTGYGKLVVLSSNFAGKEFELTRPQMIVGRTDENDLVVNHRSISRNHAKITRDPETQRYTISDLQSSNGVRVNGQDYGKVELRRGDVVDLGHVRLRFVEPGEDFVFARDAVIADVEGTGSKRGMLVAIVLALLVLGAIAAFFAMKGGDKPKQGTGSGSNRLVGDGSGSGSAAIVMAEPIDAGSAGVTTTNTDPNELKQAVAECDALVAKRDWHGVLTCSDSLTPLDKTKSDEFRRHAKVEISADTSMSNMQGSLNDEDFGKAKKSLSEIPDESSYRKDAQAAFDKAEKKFLDKSKAKAQGYANQNKCSDFDKFLSQLSDATVADQIRQQITCKAATVVAPPEDCATVFHASPAECKQQFCKNHTESSKCGGGTTAPANCDAVAIAALGSDAEGRGDHLGAVQLFDNSLRCKADPHTTVLAFMSAANGGNLGLAKKYWKRMPPGTQNTVISIAIRNHFTREQLDQ